MRLRLVLVGRPTFSSSLLRAGMVGLMAVALARLSSQAAPARSHDGMVVAECAFAAEVGAAVLSEGGGAIDAAVATAFALAVTHPAAGNLGGGGFLLHRDHTGSAIAYDFRETAPARAHERMFVRDDSYDQDLHHRHPLAVGVPGTVAGLHLAWRDAGRLPWNRLLAPAIRLAEDGFSISDSLALSLSNALPKLRRSPAALAQFSRDGQPYTVGEQLKQHDLALTLRRIADGGPPGFYHGEVAERIEEEMRRHGGWITRADLAAYEAKRRVPVRGKYRGFEVLSMSPPSSGGVVLLQMLNVLEGYDLAAAGWGSAITVHWTAETMRRGFADRARYLGDPDFNESMPIERLLSTDYAAKLRGTIRNDSVSTSAPDRFNWPPESPETTHLSVVDNQRNAVALTLTIEESYGSGIVAPGTGFLLNNEMGDFNAMPGLTTTNGLIGTDPNLAAPGKRMLSSMSPTILTKDGQLFLVLGSPGGRTIINTVLQVILNVVDHGMDLARAISAPRFHHQWLPDTIQHEPGAFSAEISAALIARGHRLAEQPSAQGAVMAIRVHTADQPLEGVADPRSGAAAAVGSDRAQSDAGVGSNLAATSRLPRGQGLAWAFPSDHNLVSHPAVIFAEDFETPDFRRRWDSVRDDAGEVLSLVDPEDATGRFGSHSLQVTATLGRNTGGGVTQWFESADPLFVRFYVKFDPACDYVHHFVTLRANRSLIGQDRWSGFGGAGLRPAGDERFSTALEPWGNWGRWPAPGRWNFYSYWHEMEPSRDGRFWGIGFRPELQPDIPRHRWICAEFMVKHNTPGLPDGEQAFWIDGELRGHWTGINWRKTAGLQANALTVETYITDRWTRNPTNIVAFDNVVIARAYIGPSRPPRN